MKLIASIIAGITLLTSLTLIILSNIEFNPIFIEIEDGFVNHEIEEVLIFQQQAKKYDLEITLFDKTLMASVSDVEIYITRMPLHIVPADPLDAVYDASSNQFKTDAFDVTDRGDFYLTVRYTKDGEANQSILPITFPIMAPKIYINQGLNNLMFEVHPQTSWSSFIDPEGISIFRSSSSIFDENAQLIAENLAITEWQYLDAGSNSETPFYYLRLSSKNNRVHYHSSVLFSTLTQTDFNARFLTNLAGDTYLELSGNAVGPNASDDILMRLRINFPNSTFIENTADSENLNAFKFLIPIDVLSIGDNSLTMFYYENGSMLEWSLRANQFDVNSISRVSNSLRIRLNNPSAINISKQYDVTFNNLESDFIVEDETVYFTLSGQAFLTDMSNVTEYRLTIGGISQTFISDVIDDSMAFKIDLSSLSTSNIWQDVRLTIVEGSETYIIDVPATSRQRLLLTYEGTYYRFQNWNNQLKIHKDS